MGGCEDEWYAALTRNWEGAGTWGGEGGGSGNGRFEIKIKTKVLSGISLAAYFSLTLKML